MIELISLYIEFILRDPFAQITGFMAMIATMIAYFQKDDMTVKKLILISSLFWWAHFYLMGLYAWLAAVIIYVFRFALSLRYKRSKWAFMAIILTTLVAAYFTFDGLFSIIPIITSMSWAYSYFFLEKIKLRLAMMFNSSLWLVYQISVWSISWILNESFVQIILLLTVYRMLHPEGGTKYYANKIKDILWKRSRPDYDRFIFIHDRVIHYRQIIWTQFLKILHYDLRKSFQKKSSIFWKLQFHKKDEVSAVDLMH